VACSVVGLAFTLLGREQSDGSDRGARPCLPLGREDGGGAASARWAGGGSGAARELGAVVTRIEERGGEEEGLTGWHSGVGAQWLARDHGMGRRRAEPARRQRLRAVVVLRPPAARSRDGATQRRRGTRPSNFGASRTRVFTGGNRRRWSSLQQRRAAAPCLPGERGAEGAAPRALFRREEATTPRR
jgi:hypothetical protein